MFSFDIYNAKWFFRCCLFSHPLTFLTLVSFSLQRTYFAHNGYLTKNHYIILCIARVCVSCSAVSNSLQFMDCSPSGSSAPWDSPGKNTGEDCHALLQGIFPTQISNPHLFCLPHWQAGSLLLVPHGKPLYEG